MASEALDVINNALEGQIDFMGQRLVEQLTTNLLGVIGLISFLIGWFTQNIYYTLWTALAGTVAVFILAVPPWPFYNKHPQTWLAPRGFPSGVTVQVQVD